MIKKTSLYIDEKLLKKVKHESIEQQLKVNEFIIFSINRYLAYLDKYQEGDDPY